MSNQLDKEIARQAEFLEILVGRYRRALVLDDPLEQSCRLQEIAERIKLATLRASTIAELSTKEAKRARL